MAADVIYKGTPRILIEEEFNQKYKIDVDKNVNSSLSFAVLPISNFMDNHPTYDYREDLVKIQFAFVSSKLAKGEKRDYDIQNIPLKLCEKSDFPTFEDKDYFELNNLKYAMCPKYKNFSLQGQFSNDQFQYVRISVVGCNNKYVPFYNFTGQCANDTVLVKEIAKIKFSLFYTFFVPSLLDGEKVKKVHLDSLGLSISTAARLNTNIFFKPNEAFTDNNILYPSYGTSSFQSELFHSYDKIENWQGQLNIDDSPWFSVNYLRASPFKITYFRSFKTIKNILSEVGGTLSTLIVLIRCFSIFYRNPAFYFDIFKLSEEEIAEVKTIPPERRKSLYKIYNSSVSELLITTKCDKDQNLTDSFRRKQKSNSPTVKRSKFSKFKAWVYYYITCCRSKQKYVKDYESLKEIVDEALNIVSYIHLYYDFQKIKNVVVEEKINKKSHFCEIQENKSDTSPPYDQDISSNQIINK